MKKYVRKISAAVTAIMVVIVALLGTRVEARAEAPSLAGTEWVLYRYEVSDIPFNIGDNIGGRVLSEDMCTLKFFNEENIRFSCSLLSLDPTDGKFFSFGDNKYVIWGLDDTPESYEDAIFRCAIDGDYIKVMVPARSMKFTLRKTNALAPTPTPAPSSPTHVHEWVEGEIYAATQHSDGLGGTYCKSCGAIKESYPISAYGYALNDYAGSMINAAKSGQTITFEFGEWNSFPRSFMEKLAAKSAQNVTFVFHYKWNHVKQEITIPAGTPIDLNFDYYGPAKMAELYGAY